MLRPEKFVQVPKTKEDIQEYIKYHKKKMRLAKILEKKMENETRILLKKQYKEIGKVKEKPGIHSDIKMFMFKQPPVEHLKSFDYLGSEDSIQGSNSIRDHNASLQYSTSNRQNPAIIAKYSL
mmetsp:Transcript_27033/g.23860  ORF Transcript_27033/g.23860 Transcript_27033/m.23860 type:complete len:123 (+) Transcript_27033:1059-1427(+)